MSRLERRIEENKRRIEKNDMITEHDVSGANTFREIQTAMTNVGKDGRYMKARKSLRIWPIPGEGKNIVVALADFLQDKLYLNEDVVEQVNECTIRKIPKGRDSKMKHEVSVEFPSVEIRDVVRSAAFNLADQPDAGIRLEIAPHLMSDFKALSNASYRLRQKFPGCRRNIKYDDECCNLVLDFRTNETTQWRTLRADEARKMATEAGRVDNISASDMSELLDGDGELDKDGARYA